MTIRAARWIRESSKAQDERYGPEAQKARQDAAIAEHDATDTGIVFRTTKSGSQVDTTPEWADMLARAGSDYDRLYVGYVSRFARDPELIFRAVRLLTEAGADVYFCDERLLTSDDRHYDWWAREAVEAKSYLNRLKRRLRETKEEQWRLYGETGGSAPLGFAYAKEGGRYRLQVDPGTIGQAVYLFERYSLGHLSQEALADEIGLEPERIKNILRNPVYNGYRVNEKTGEQKPAAWRDDPPVSDELWGQVAAVRESRTRGGGTRTSRRATRLLSGLVYCASCGKRLRYDGDYRGTHRTRHVRPCADWGAEQRYASRAYEDVIVSQFLQWRLDGPTKALIANAFAAPPPLADRVGLQRIKNERRTLREYFDTGALTATEFVSKAAVLDEQQRGILEVPVPSGVTSDEALAALSDLQAVFADADEDKRADVLHAAYARIDVLGPQIVGVALTPYAEARGLAVVLPENVKMRSIGVKAPPEGFEPPTPALGRRRSIH